jgi:oligoendopeptidase F
MGDVKGAIMEEKLKERSELNKEDTWDLTTLYADDEAWEKAFQGLDAKVASVAAYQGKLKDAETILAFLEARTALGGEVENMVVYAELRNSEDTRDPKAQGMYARAGMWLAKAQAALSFAEPEILNLPEETLKKIAEDPLLKAYAFYLGDLLRQKPHTLSGREEAVLAKLSDALDASGQTATALMDADLKFAEAQDEKGASHEVTGASYIPLQMSQDRVLRRNSFKSFYASYKDHINTFANTYAGCVKAAAAEAEIRHYSSSRAMAMAVDNIPETVYDSLIDSVHAHMETMYRYERLRKRLLKIDDLHYYDLYAPLAQGNSRLYSYEQAQQMVLEAVAPLGQAYVDRVKQAYKDRWIDVYPNKGKTGGAFSSGTYDSNPFILLNFTGSLDSVSTIAHEMGHSQHSWLTNHTQPRQYSGYTMFVAEIASTVNENLLIEQLLQKEQDPRERLDLLNQYLEGFKGTIYRQTMFAEFEKEAHAMVERGEALDSASLNALYQRLIKLYFGEELVLDEEVQYEWARIPHFYRPFYVYVYATGYASASALAEKILKEGRPAVDRYLEFLSMGASAYPLDELKHAGVDLTTPAPVDQALEKFAQVVAEAEKTADILGL